MYVYCRLLSVSQFVPKEDIMEVCKAILAAQRDHGNREVRANARMKYLVHSLGIDAFRTLVESYLGKKVKSNLSALVHVPRLLELCFRELQFCFCASTFFLRMIIPRTSSDYFLLERSSLGVKWRRGSTVTGWAGTNMVTGSCSWASMWSREGSRMKGGFR